MKKWLVRGVVVGALAVMTMASGFETGQVLAQEGPSGGPGGGRRTPPPEAYKACEGKTEGSSAQLTTPEGRTLTGTCRQIDNKLVLIPEFMKDRSCSR